MDILSTEQGNARIKGQSQLMNNPSILKKRSWPYGDPLWIKLHSSDIVDLRWQFKAILKFLGATLILTLENIKIHQPSNWSFKIDYQHLKCKLLIKGSLLSILNQLKSIHSHGSCAWKNMSKE